MEENDNPTIEVRQMNKNTTSIVTSTLLALLLVFYQHVFYIQQPIQTGVEFHQVSTVGQC